jgi:hypothetical protein
MRMMVTIRVPVETGNRAIKDGSLPRIIKEVTERIRPECAYFFIESGRRTMRAVFDLKNTNDMVPDFEPALLGLDAELELIPVMTAEELSAGFKALG